MQLLKKWIFGLLLLPQFMISSEEKSFAIVIPSYNNSKWYEQNLDSVFFQKYQNYRVIYIADGPTDGTGELVEKYIEMNYPEKQFTLIKNEFKKGPLACLYQGISSCKKEEIVIDLDGNDWLAHDYVLLHLNAIYADPDVWMTYGQFTFYPEYREGFASQIPKDVMDNNSFRSWIGVSTFPRTFYAALFQAIPKEDLIYEGNFIAKAFDLAYSIPMMEMAAKHIRFVPSILYIYNATWPRNDHKASNEWEEKMDRFVRSKNGYNPLTQLFQPEH
jgi:glycosyltransferase involved in cell wall biosynthesis